MDFRFALGFFNISSSKTSKNDNVLEAVGFEGCLQVCRNRDAYTFILQLIRSYPSKTRLTTNPNLRISPGPVPLVKGRPSSRSGQYSTLYFSPFALHLPHQPQSFSRAALASASIFTVGSIAWYTHLYGSLPFIGEVHANSPAEDGLHSTAYPWSHNGWFDTFDHARCSLPRPLRFFTFLKRFKHSARLSGLS